MAVNLKSGLLVYSRLDSTSAFVNGTLTESYWTNNGVTFIGAGGFNQNCAYFDANTDYLQRASFPALPATHTISFWVICTLATTHIIYGLADANDKYYLDYASGKLKLTYYTNGNTGTYYSKAMSLNVWHNVTILYHPVDAFGVIAAIYIDGTDQSDHSLDVGAAGGIASSTWKFNNASDEFGILGFGLWNRNLNAAEIAVLYNKGISYPFNDSRGAIAMYF